MVTLRHLASSLHRWSQALPEDAAIDADRFDTIARRSIAMRSVSSSGRPRSRQDRRAARAKWPYCFARELDLYTGPLGPHTVAMQPVPWCEMRTTVHMKAGS